MATIRLPALAGTLLLLPALGLAQHIVSARAGLIHYSDGRVLLNEKPIVHKASQFEEVKAGEYLRTERGRAEVLLTPGVFVRLGEDTQVQMLSTRLSDVQLRIMKGAAVIEADELTPETSVRVTVGETQVKLERNGLYRFDATSDEDPRLRVFSGEASVTARSADHRLKAKKEMDLAGDFTIRKFDPEDTDPLDRWSRRRANYLAVANVSASRMVYERGDRYSASRWIWNPYYGMYTFLPVRGVIWSPYGYGFYSPRAVYVLYNPPRPAVNSAGFGAPSRAYSPSYGYNTVGQTSAGNSGVVASSPSSGANQSGGATVSRGGDTGGGGARR